MWGNEENMQQNATTKQTSHLQLSDSQLKAFLHSTGISEKLVVYFNELPSKFDLPVQSILDCGGGNGMCLDMLLDRFPGAEGTLVDSAQFMLDQNTHHPRKKLVLENLENMSSLFDSGQKFDLICFFDVLHHCIASSYAETRKLQTTILKTAVKLLAPNGRIFISERIFDSWITDEFSTYMVYSLTRSRTLSAIIRLFGANTAGVGVCFTSRKRMQKLCEDAGLTILEEISANTKRKFSLKRLLTRNICLGASLCVTISFYSKCNDLSANMSLLAGEVNFLWAGAPAHHCL